MTGTLSINNTRLMVSSSRLNIPTWKSAHKLSGQDNFWNPAGIVGGYFTDTAPDSATAGTLGGPPGARAALYEDFGMSDVDVTLVWNGVHDAQAGPMVCINTAEDEFGLTFYRETSGVLAGWHLWNVGRDPSQLTSAMPAVAQDAPHVDGDDVTLRMVVDGDNLKCYGDGDLKFDYTIPANLLGSTIHGVSVDVHLYSGRPADLPCALASSFVLEGI